MAICSIMTSCGVMQSGEGRTVVQQAAQIYSQSERGGTYVGIAGSQNEAKTMAERAGYSRYQWYPSTGQCFGY